MRHTLLVVAVLLLPACRSCERRATDYAFDLRYDMPACRIDEETIERVQFIQKWRPYSADDVKRHAFFYQTRSKLEGCVISGAVAAEVMGRFVVAVDEPKVTDWWKARGPVLSAWHTRARAPRLEVKWKNEYLEDDTRRGILTGLGFASNGFAISGELKNPITDDEKPWRTLPASFPGEAVGTITVDVSAHYEGYETKKGDSAGVLTNAQDVKFSIDSTVPLTWEAERSVVVGIAAPTQVRLKDGAPSRDTEDSQIFKLAEAIANEMAKLPPLEPK